MRRSLTLFALALASAAFGLGVGDKAPPLKVETLVKGSPVDLDRGVHVVEFWATWLKPSTATIPRLTELAHKYRGKVDFTGVSVAERGDDPLGQVKRFVVDQGPKMDYNVAYDGAAKAMQTTYLEAFGSVAHPATFLIKDGQVLWIGHPAQGLDEAIGQTLKGKFDLAASKAAFEKQTSAAAAAQKKQADMQKFMQPVVEDLQQGDVDGAMKDLEGLEKTHPDLKSDFAQARFGLLLPTGDPKLVELAKRFATDDFKDDALELNSMAWSIIDPKTAVPNRNYDAALILAKRAAEVSKMKDGSILDTYALALYKTGNRAKAIDLQAKAVELAKKDKDVDAESLKGMEDRLAEFKRTSV